MANPNLQLLTDAAKLLEPILGELVFVGGCATALLISDTAAADVRPTFDVDAIAEITSKLTQCQYLRDAIRSTLSKNGNIRHYEVFHGDIAEFERPGPQQELRDHIRTACFQ